MSAANVIQNARARTVSAQGTVKDQEETLYTCPANCRAHMSLLYIHNGGGATTDVDIHWDRNDSSRIYIIEGKNLSPSEFIQWSNAFIVIEPGEVICFTPKGNNSPQVDVFITVEEFFLVPG